MVGEPDHTTATAARARRVSRRFSGVFIRGFPPNEKTTRQRDKRREKSQNVSRVLLSLARRRLSIWVVCYQVPQADLNRNW